MDSVSHDLKMYVCKFFELKGLNVVRGVNREFRKMGNLLKNQVMCREYRLIRGENKLSNEDYDIVIEGAISSMEAKGSWHTNDNYWSIEEIYGKLSWFEYVKKCDYVWWFDYSVTSKPFKRGGKYQIWMRSVMDAEGMEFRVDVFNSAKRVLGEIMKFEGGNEWCDYKLGTIEVGKGDIIEVSIENHDANIIKKELQFAFTYFYPADDIDDSGVAKFLLCE